MAEAMNCVVCTAHCSDDDLSWKRVTEVLSCESATIEQFLLTKDVIPAEETVFGNSRICQRCHSLVFYSDSLYNAAEAHVRKLREIRAHVMGCVLQKMSSNFVDGFFEEDLARETGSLSALPSLVFDDFPSGPGSSDDSWTTAVDVLSLSPCVTSDSPGWTSAANSIEFRCESISSADDSPSLAAESPDLNFTRTPEPEQEPCPVLLVDTKDFEVKEEEEGEEGSGGGVVSLTCGRCKIQCKSPTSLANHKSKCNPGERPFVCDVCDMRFKSAGRLETHRANAHGIARKRFPCPHCNTRLRSHANLKKHLEACNSNAVRICPECGEEVKACNLRRHVNQRHKRARNEPPVACPHCENTVFRQRISLKRHLFKEHGIGSVPVRPSERGHTCPHCNMFYRCVKHFTAHMFEKHGIALPGLEEYKCSICDKVFYVKQRYEVHMGGHSEVPKYSCQDCGYKTHFSSSLSAHKRKMHKCPTGLSVPDEG